jgi:hypothetical protein
MPIATFKQYRTRMILFAIGVDIGQRPEAITVAREAQNKLIKDNGRPAILPLLPLPRDKDFQG